MISFFLQWSRKKRISPVGNLVKSVELRATSGICQSLYKKERKVLNLKYDTSVLVL